MFSSIKTNTALYCLLVLGWVGFVCPPLTAQTRDSLLEWRLFRREVLSYHPLAQQANLATAAADAVLLRAQGGFDPKLFADVHEKSFSNTQYYHYSESGIKWPSWMGIELKGAYNWAGGFYLNPESNLPANGQANLGLNWSLGQGLLMDERRAGLQQAKIGLQMGAAERDAQLNDLLYAGAKAYWDWVLANTQLAVLEAALVQAQIRFEGIRESHVQGDKPAIDTLETFIQVQNRLLDVNFAQVDVQNTRLILNTYLWNADGAPLEPTSVPPPPTLPKAEAIGMPPSEQLLANIDQHPALRAYQAKLNDLSVEQRLKMEKRKPVLDVQYSILGNGWQFFPTPGAEGLSTLTNDVKWGVQFSYPILNRKARGDFQVNTIKIAQTDFAFQQKRVDVENKMRTYINELQNLQKQIDLYQSITNNYRALLDGENEKFRFGESSVFLINTREQRWLEAQIKLFKLQSEYRKTEAGLLWASGVLNNY